MTVATDCEALFDNMSDSERAIFTKHWGVDPLFGLRQAYEMSVLCWTIWVDGKASGIVGVCEGEEPEVGHPWLVTGQGIEKVKLRFIRNTKPYMEQMVARFPVLVAYAREDNTQLVGWLKFNKFKIEPYGEGFVRCVYHR